MKIISIIVLIVIALLLYSIMGAITLYGWSDVWEAIKFAIKERNTK